MRLTWPEPVKWRTGVEGKVIHIDRFGNAITNLDGSLTRSWERVVCEAHVRRRRVCPLKTFYQAVGPGQPLALVGSSGLLEIAVNGGSAERTLGLKIGTRVVLRPG